MGDEGDKGQLLEVPAVSADSPPPSTSRSLPHCRLPMLPMLPTLHALLSTVKASRDDLLLTARRLMEKTTSSHSWEDDRLDGRAASSSGLRG